MKSELYAVCQNCSAIFLVNNFIGGNGIANVTFNNCYYGPCPNCGGNGKIPDGEYKFSNNILKFIKGPNFSKDLVSKLKKYFENLQTDIKDKAEIIKEVNDISPEFASVLQKSSDVDYHKWIGTVLSILTFLITLQQSYFKSDKTDDDYLTNIIVLELIKQNKQTQKIISQNTNQLIRNENILQKYKLNNKTAKVGRNDVCPCGSGIKFKKCCLQKK